MLVVKEDEDRNPKKLSVIVIRHMYGEKMDARSQLSLKYHSCSGRWHGLRCRDRAKSGSQDYKKDTATIPQ